MRCVRSGNALNACVKFIDFETSEAAHHQRSILEGAIHRCGLHSESEALESLHSGWNLQKDRTSTAMKQPFDFSTDFARSLPDTHALLQAVHLVIHPNVVRIVLHGSRGLAGGARPDSDIDLSLIVDLPVNLEVTQLEPFLHEVFETTFNAWHSEVEPDLAVIFETRSCGLGCFTQKNWQDGLCSIGGLDCFGLYKAQKGFNGLVTNAGIQVKRMYPCLEIWRRAIG